MVRSRGPLLNKIKYNMEKQIFFSAIEQICEEKGLTKEKVLETIETALAAAYKKDYGQKSQIVRVKMDAQTGAAEITQVKLVLDESMIKTEEEIEEEKEEREEGGREEIGKMEEGIIKKVRFNPERHIMIEDAKKINKKLKAGDELILPLAAHEEFGRIAAQTAKQVILQCLKEAEREAVYDEYKSKEQELVSGIVQRMERGAVLVDLGRTVGILYPEEQIVGEYYRTGQRLKFLVLEVNSEMRGAQIILSRVHPKLLSKLFELEVPEVANETVEIKAIAREAGLRSKIAVASTVENVDPIGSCVGQKGTRVQAVINELGGEKIDIIEWSDDPAKFISNALSPAKVLDVEVDEARGVAKATVPEEQLSLAIGKRGQNVRLAVKLTNWKIDVLSRSGVKVEIEDMDEEAETGEEIPETGKVDKENAEQKAVGNAPDEEIKGEKSAEKEAADIS